MVHFRSFRPDLAWGSFRRSQDAALGLQNEVAFAGFRNHKPIFRRRAFARLSRQPINRRACNVEPPDGSHLCWVLRPSPSWGRLFAACVIFPRGVPRWLRGSSCVFRARSDVPSTVCRAGMMHERRRGGEGKKPKNVMKFEAPVGGLFTHLLYLVCCDPWHKITQHAASCKVQGESVPTPVKEKV